MQSAAHHSSEVQQGATAEQFPPLELVTRPTVATNQAAYYLNRAQRTLLIWACKSGKGPITPLRVGGRLAWPVADIKRVLGVGQ
jgi:hypothetical protein